MVSEKFELVVTRRPNYSALGLRTLPTNKAERDKMQQVFNKLDQTVQNSHLISIEDMRDFLQEVS